MKKGLLSLLFSIAVLGAIFAQDATLKGVVYDENNEPLFGANVIIDAAKGWAAATDFDGKYSITLPAGTYYVLYKHISQKNEIKEITLAAGETKDVSMSLMMMENEIGQVTVSATKRGITLEKEVVSVEVLSADLLQSNNMTNGAEAVDKVPGVTVIDGQASIRGGSGYAYGVGSRVILVIDDIPLLSPERAEILWDYIPMENIETMEVVKGASSVQYGASALNGIINVNTGWAKKDKETEITTFATVYNKPNKEIAGAQWWKYFDGDRTDPQEIGVNAVHRRKINENMDFVVGGTVGTNQTHIESQSLNKIRNQIKWRWRPEKIEGLTLELNSNTLYRYKDVFFLWEGYDDRAYQGQSYEDRYLRTNIDPKIKYFFNEKNSIQSLNRFYYDKRISNEYFSSMIFNDLQYTRTYGRKNIAGSASFGFVNSNSTIKGDSFKEFSKEGDGVFKQNNLAVYGQSQFSFKELTLTAGGRFDWATLDGISRATRPVFNAGASYKFNRANIVRFNFGQSFRVAGVAERFVFEEIYSAGSLTAFAGPNPDIRPESGYTVELGYKRILKFGKWQGMADAAVFYQDFHDMTEFTFGVYDHPFEEGTTFIGFQNQNLTDAKIFGWETSLNGYGKIGKIPVTILAGYTYNYGANADENPQLSNIGGVIKGAFNAFKIKDEEYEAYLTADDDEKAENPLHGILHYRFRHTIKLDLSADFGPVTLGTNMRYYSYVDDIDPVFNTILPGIGEYRASRNYKGDYVMDLRGFYKVNDLFRFGLIVKNVMNNNYQIRPAKPDAPRTFTVQGKFTF